jgi:hypothetical protein
MERSELILKRGGFEAVAHYTSKSVEVDPYNDGGDCPGYLRLQMAAIEGGLPALTPADVEMVSFLIKRLRRWNQTGTRKEMSHIFEALAMAATAEHFGIEPCSPLSEVDWQRLREVGAKVVESWVRGKAFFRLDGGAV